MNHYYRLQLFALVVIFAFAVESSGQTRASTGKQDGPVQGYQGGYDPTDKSKAPAAPGGGKAADAANPDEGRAGNQASGTVSQIDGRRLTLDTGLVLVVPPTLELGFLTRGARIKALYEQQEGANVVTGIVRE
ncbi:MAG TPA: hypothetical protein VF014_10405 [Casimicrobiaceae bacterium]|nr:hypothetical protein [Casimicrobiaceae bacterium]